MNFRKLKLITFLGVTTTAVGALSSCSSLDYSYQRGSGNDISAIDKNFPTNKSMHKNVMTTYYNDTDMFASLGYIPDYASVSSSHRIYSDYLKGLLGDNNGAETSTIGKVINTGKYQIKAAPRIFDGQRVDKEELLDNNISTLLLNEWERVDESKFINVVPALIYTSMGDGFARYFDNNEDFVKNGYSKWGFSVTEAFQMFAKGLDRGYLGHDFLKKANSELAILKNNISNVASAISTSFANKSIVFLEPTFAGDGQTISWQIRTPGIFSEVYSNNNQIGVGLKFPTLADKSQLQMTDFSITAKNSAVFFNELHSTSDYAIVLENNTFSEKQKQAIQSEVNSSEFQGILKPGGTSKIVDRDMWYDSAWAPYGENQLLKELCGLLGIDSSGVKDLFNYSKGLRTLR